MFFLYFQRLAWLLYLAAEDALLDPDDVERILGVSRDQANQLGTAQQVSPQGITVHFFVILVPNGSPDCTEIKKTCLPRKQICLQPTAEKPVLMKH